LLPSINMATLSLIGSSFALNITNIKLYLRTIKVFHRDRH
jgi:hypothetical protein